jgi:putative Ca2+/H+ antiporter (TMEM165/GDT1 family)
MSVRAAATSTAADDSFQPSTDTTKKQSGTLVLGATAVAAAAAAVYIWQTGSWPAITDYLQHSQLGRSGFLAAFALIFLSELGDKTFFIAALLAMKVGRWLSFAGSLTALGLMSVLSVGIGFAFKQVPDAIKGSVPIGEYLGIALLVYFGLRTLKEAWDSEDDGKKGEEEYEAAGEELTAAEKKWTGTAWWQRFFEVASLIFVAECGDRSMLATIALGASQSAVGVALGATAGHAVATALAVLGGALASKYVSEKTVGYIGGTLFLVFAATALLGVY